MVTNIKGSGLNNRITKMDIINFVNSNKSNTTEENVRVSRSEVDQSTKKLDSVQTNDKRHAISKFIEKDISNLRRKIMDNMVKSKKTSAHVSTFFKVDYSNVNTYRKNYIRQNDGYKLTYTDFVVASVAKVLSKHPYINSEIRNEKLLFKKTRV
jgi:2-oxoglutarate dehydrogenase E2 component (dihydrolipoamide succinyltransferase)